MIKANELRIGNYFLRKGNKMPVCASNIGMMGVNITWGNKYLKYDEMEAIPLTPELLEKAGFVDLENLPLDLKEAQNGYDVFYVINEMEGFPIQQIQYVHQLQNLFFALTGKELEINLT